MATSGDDLLFGTLGPDFIDGLAGNDFLIGLEGNDTLVGGEGNDLLIAEENLFSDAPVQTSADDSMSGGPGNDAFFTGPGNNTVDGGEGHDAAYYGVATGGITVDLAISEPQTVGGGMGVETIRSIERVVAESFNDTLLGSDQNDHAEFFHPRGGDDYVDGRGGQNVVSYSDARSGITVNLNLTGPQSIGGGEGVDTLLHIQAVVGGQDADHLIGNDGANTLTGNTGDDTLEGGAGKDLLIGNGSVSGQENDYLDGGPGHDAARFTGAISDYSFDFQPGGKLVVTDLRPDSPDGTDTLVRVEALQFAPIQFDSNGFLVSAPNVPLGALHAYSRLHQLAEAAPPAAQEVLSTEADPLIARTLGLFSVDAFAV